MVDWQALTSEAGLDMASTIFRLSSEDLEIRKEALDGLYDICWHQGSIYEKSSVAIPFLIERIQVETDLNLLQDLIWRIYHIGTGSSYHDVHQTLIINRERKNTPEYQAKIAEELQWVDAVTREFNKGIKVYLKLLTHESENIRLEAVRCISSCFVYSKYVVDDLYKHFANESDEQIKSIIPLCLAFFSDKETINVEFLEQILDTEKSDLVKLSASIALAYIMKKNLSYRIFNTLTELISEWTFLQELYDDYEIAMCYPHGCSIIYYLQHLSEDRLLEFLPKVFEAFLDTYDYGGLLSITFPPANLPEGTTINELSESQQYLLKEIVKRNPNDKDRVYKEGSLLFLGIPTYPDARERMVNFVNGSPVKYEEYYKKLFNL